MFSRDEQWEKLDNMIGLPHLPREVVDPNNFERVMVSRID